MDHHKEPSWPNQRRWYFRVRQSGGAAEVYSSPAPHIFTQIKNKYRTLVIITDQIQTINHTKITIKKRNRGIS